MLASSALSKAVRNNPIYARRLGWLERFGQISSVLGFSNMSPGPEAFAEGVAKWQKQQQGLKADGMLGPKSWAVMEPKTRFTRSFGSPPEWVRHCPAPAVPADAGSAPDISTNIWFGLSGEIGGHLVLAGTNTMMGRLYSLDSYDKQFSILSERIRVGPGLGGGIGVSFMMITGLQAPMDLDGKRMRNVDFQLSIGAKWGELIKGAHKFRSVRNIVRAMENSSGGRRAAYDLAKRSLTQATRLSPEEWNDLRKRIGELLDAANLDTEPSSPQVMSMGIPIPGALEASLFWQSGRLQVSNVTS